MDFQISGTTLGLPHVEDSANYVLWGIPEDPCLLNLPYSWVRQGSNTQMAGSTLRNLNYFTIMGFYNSNQNGTAFRA